MKRDAVGIQGRQNICAMWDYGSDLFRRIYDKGTLYDPSFYKDECRTLENGTSLVRLSKTYLSKRR